MWKYKNGYIKDINDFPESSFGFVYKITNLTTNKSYIGKKFLYHKTKKKIGNKFKRTLKESDWKTYNGSNKQLKIDISNGHEIEREILNICRSPKHLTYTETKLLFLNEVLEKDEYYNDNINGKFYRKDT